MRAVSIQPAHCRVQLIEVAPPGIEAPNQVRLRMLEVGICGTDREIAACQYGTPPENQESLVIGHESLGQVVEIGSEVRGLAVGDLVVPMVRRPCPHAHCKPCRSGRQDFCTTGDFAERGIKGAHGFMTEFVVDDEAFMVRVPQALRDVAVLVEPLTIAEKALAQVATVQTRLPWACELSEIGTAENTCHRALVLGAGPVGLLGAMALVHAGFDTIVYSKTPEPNDRADLVQAIGARYVSTEEVEIDQLFESIGEVDLVYEAVGASQLAFDILARLGNNGIFVFTGVPARKSPIEIDADLLMRRIVLQNQVVLGSVNAGRSDFERAIQDLGEFKKRWPEALRSMIRHHAFEDVESLLTGHVKGIKNVLSIAGSLS